MHVNEATGKPIRQRHRETREFASAAVRFNRGLGARVASGEVADLAEFTRVQASLDAAKVAAIEGLLDFGYSWAEIGESLGISRQGAQQWYRRNKDAEVAA